MLRIGRRNDGIVDLVAPLGVHGIAALNFGLGYLFAYHLLDATLAFRMWGLDILEYCGGER